MGRVTDFAMEVGPQMTTTRCRRRSSTSWEVIAMVTGFHLLAGVDPRRAVEHAEDDAVPSRLVGPTTPELRQRASATGERPGRPRR